MSERIERDTPTRRSEAKGMSHAVTTITAPSAQTMMTPAGSLSQKELRCTRREVAICVGHPH